MCGRGFKISLNLCDVINERHLTNFCLVNSQQTFFISLVSCTTFFADLRAKIAKHINCIYAHLKINILSVLLCLVQHFSTESCLLYLPSAIMIGYWKLLIDENIEFKKDHLVHQEQTFYHFNFTKVSYQIELMILYFVYNHFQMDQVLKCLLLCRRYHRILPSFSNLFSRFFSLQGFCFLLSLQEIAQFFHRFRKSHPTHFFS